MGKERTILHMDGDAFFVACEVAKNPKLRGLPVVTGEERGIASALSYEAKALGISRGFPIYKIKKNFPQVIVLPGDYASYAKFSREMFDVVRRYTDEVEEYSIDECFADLTGWSVPLKMTYFEIAKQIKKEINKELDLSVSLGVAPTKCLAKVASKWQKPDGLTEITKDRIPEFLAKISIEKIWGIGRRTSEFLGTKQILTALDFIRKDIGWIRENMSKPYEVIWQELRGTPVMKIDSSRKEDYSSIQKTRTFWPATDDKIFLLSQLSKNIELACDKARYYKLVPKKVLLFLKTQEFKYHVTELPLEIRSNNPEAITTLARKYFSRMHKTGILYRTTGVVLRELVPLEAQQLDLFGQVEKINKFDAVHEQIDSLEEKFGKNVVYLASTHKSLGHKVKGTDADDKDRNLLFM